MRPSSPWKGGPGAKSTPTDSEPCNPNSMETVGLDSPGSQESLHSGNGNTKWYTATRTPSQGTSRNTTKWTTDPWLKMNQGIIYRTQSQTDETCSTPSESNSFIRLGSWTESEVDIQPPLVESDMIMRHNKRIGLFEPRNRVGPEGSYVVRGSTTWHRHYRREKAAEATRFIEPFPVSNSYKFPTAPDSPNKGYYGDREGTWTPSEETVSEVGEPEVETNIHYMKSLPKGVLANLNSVKRYCVFHTEDLTAKEFWQTLRARIHPGTVKGIIKVKKVLQPNGRPRMDIWVLDTHSHKLKQQLGLDSTQRRNGATHSQTDPGAMFRDEYTKYPIPDEMKRWRIDTWRPYRDRQADFVKPVGNTKNERPRMLCTLNVNGLGSKRKEIIDFMNLHKVGVIALQETLLRANLDYPFIPRDYRCFHSYAKDGFRGMSLLVHKDYNAWAIESNSSTHHLHIRVSGLTANTPPWHLIPFYLPSGGNRRSGRTRAWNKVMALYKSIVEKDPKAVVVLMGDANWRRKTMEKKLTPAKTGLQLLRVVGSPVTFHRKGTQWSDIDHMVVNGEAQKLLCPASVKRSWTFSGDHYPLVAKISADPKGYVEVTKSRFKFDTDLIKGQGRPLVCSNRWNALSLLTDETTDDVDELTDAFIQTAHEVGMEYNIAREVQKGRHTFNGKLQRRLKQVTKARKLWEQACRNQEVNRSELERNFKKLRFKFRKETAQRERVEQQREVKKVKDLCTAQESRKFHQWEKKNVSGKQRDSQLLPVQTEKGELLTNSKDILSRQTEYWSNLVADTDGRSKNREEWDKSKDLRTPLDQRPEPYNCNEDPSWHEVIEAIRSSQNATAPGVEHLPIELFKLMTKEECREWLKQMNGGCEPEEPTVVALPLEQCPPDPVTPMGRAVFKLILGIWNHEYQPKSLRTAINVALFKSGDPTKLTNYRGISLIPVFMKIVTTMVARRIAKNLEMDEALVQEQGGFRSAEEAVAQFIALYEIVRRRRLRGSKTWLLFIDFRKAFDKVLHEALYDKLEAIGFRGRILRLIRNIYSTSRMKVRVGNEEGDIYDILRGVRQGCPLSPILFLIFINDLKKYLPNGVEIPNVADKRCNSLLFADDVVALLEKEDEINKCIDAVAKWCKDWGMSMGEDKCGLLLVGGSEAETKQWWETPSITRADITIEKVKKYKYLGIIVTENLGDKAQTDEIAHCRTLAERVKQAVNIRRNFLRDAKWPVAIKIRVLNEVILPLGLYGGEWVGLCQRRTNIIQSQVNVAIRLIMGSSSKSKLYSTSIMSAELGIRTVEQSMADARIRLWYKADKLKTWISTLADTNNRFIHRSKVWSTQTERAVKSLLKGGKADSFNWLAKNLAMEGKYDEPTKPLEERSEGEKLDVQMVRDHAKIQLLGRAIDIAIGDKVASVVMYRAWNFLATRRFIASATNIAPVQGVLWLIRLRTGSWWSVKTRNVSLAATGRPTLNPTECPVCKAPFGTLSELAHIMLECKRYDGKRKELLFGPMRSLRKVLEKGGGLASINKVSEELTMHLLGAHPTESRFFGNWPMEHPTVETETWKEREAGFIETWVSYWGGFKNFVDPTIGSQYFLPVTIFLQHAMEIHRTSIFENSGQLERIGEPGTSGYVTTADEFSPVKSTRPTRRVNRLVKQREEQMLLVTTTNRTLQANEYAYLPDEGLAEEPPSDDGDAVMARKRGYTIRSKVLDLESSEGDSSSEGEISIGYAAELAKHVLLR